MTDPQTTTFEIWVAVGPDGYKVCLGSGMSRATARRLADEVHFPDGRYALYCVTATVPVPPANAAPTGEVVPGEVTT